MYQGHKAKKLFKDLVYESGGHAILKNILPIFLRKHFCENSSDPKPEYCPAPPQAVHLTPLE